MSYSFPTTTTSISGRHPSTERAYRNGHKSLHVSSTPVSDCAEFCHLCGRKANRSSDGLSKVPGRVGSCHCSVQGGCGGNICQITSIHSRKGQGEDYIFLSGKLPGSLATIARTHQSSCGVPVLD